MDGKAVPALQRFLIGLLGAVAGRRLSGLGRARSFARFSISPRLLAACTLAAAILMVANIEATAGRPPSGTSSARVSLSTDGRDGAPLSGWNAGSYNAAPASFCPLGAVTPTSPTDQRPLAIRDTASANFELSVRVRTVSGKGRASAGVAVRLLTPDDYYAVEVDAFRAKVAFLLVSHGRSAEIKAVNSDISLGVWHELRVRVEDDRFLISLDGKWLFTAYDRTLPSSGSSAVWTTPSDRATQFDDFVVTPRGALETSEISRDTCGDR